MLAALDAMPLIAPLHVTALMITLLFYRRELRAPLICGCC